MFLNPGKCIKCDWQGTFEGCQEVYTKIGFKFVCPKCGGDVYLSGSSAFGKFDFTHLFQLGGK